LQPSIEWQTLAIWSNALVAPKPKKTLAQIFHQDTDPSLRNMYKALVCSIVVILLFKGLNPFLFDD
jgi:hypothetical protein